jgi:hypothetical protein
LAGKNLQKMYYLKLGRHGISPISESVYNTLPYNKRQDYEYRNEVAPAIDDDDNYTSPEIASSFIDSSTFDSTSTNDSVATADNSDSFSGFGGGDFGGSGSSASWDSSSDNSSSSSYDSGSSSSYDSGSSSYDSGSSSSSDSGSSSSSDW